MLLLISGYTHHLTPYYLFLGAKDAGGRVELVKSFSLLEIYTWQMQPWNFPSIKSFRFEYHSAT